MASKIVVDRVNEVEITPVVTGATITITDEKTLTVTDDTTLGGGTHSGTNTGDQDLSGYLTKADNLGSVANAATAFANIKQTATESATGVAELATVTEAITGTDTSRITTPAGLAGAMAVQTNPLAKSQGVHMTYAASGSSGIAVADNDNIDFGTGDFTLVWKGSLPDWTPAYNVYLISKYQDASNQVYVAVDNGGTLSFYSTKAGTVARADSSIVNTLTNNSEHEIVFVVIRESLGANGNCSVYIDGKLFETLTISAASPIDISNTGALNIAGRNAARYDSVNKSAYTYNRALTAAEVLDLYRNGIAFADKWGSQTAKYSDTAWTGASGATPPTGWSLSTAGTFTIFDSGDSTPYNACLKIEHNGVNNNPGITKAYTTEVGKKYKFITFFKHGTATNGIIRLGTSAGGTQYTSWTPTDATWTKYSYEFEATTTTTYVTFYIVTSTSGQYELFDETFLYQIGSTVALEPEGIQPAPGQWLDSSTNKLHAMQPASGSSLTRKKDTFEVRWTNTWAGTHEAQYIGGFNQAVLPANCYIESIIGVISGSTIEDIIIGDGSDTDRWVTITTGLSAGTTSFTLANRISDGTNYKLVVDPDANFTGSIAWTIKGIILQ